MTVYQCLKEEVQSEEKMVGGKQEESREGKTRQDGTIGQGEDIFSFVRGNIFAIADE